MAWIEAPTGDEAAALEQVGFKPHTLYVPRDEAIERVASALERIATALERFEPADEPECAHPESEREVTPDSTMAHVTYRCKACGQEGI